MRVGPGAQLGPYSITAELGHGGMGVVYTAHDPRLDRQVAIKILPPDLTRDETAKQRFLQEAKAASALDHPNICNIHEINETDDGQLYLVMALYEGETLKERIDRGPLALDDAIDVATQVGRGLAKAHAAGIIHRDIKPANVMVTSDRTVKILDFGLAKLAGAEGVTQTGTTVGTVAYMSPEQARGQEVDHRTDIWSLGVVLYEMVAGEPPFRGENLLSLAEAIRSQEPEPLTGVPATLQAAIAQALAKNSAERPLGVTELTNAFRSSESATAPVAVLSTTSPLAVAVLPFQLLAGGPDDAFLSVALAEAVTHGLGQNEQLVVRPTSAVMRYTGEGARPETVAHELNVQFVVEGSIQKLGPQVRVQVQAWDANQQATVFSVKEDGQTADLFGLQDRLSDTLERAFGFTNKPPSSVEPATLRPRAYEHYLRASDRLLRYNPHDTRDAVDMFRAAVEADPTFAGAWARLATAAVQMAALFDPAPRWYQQAEDAVARALQLDPANPEAWVARGRILWSPHHGFCHAEALREFAKVRAFPSTPHDAPLWEGIVQLHVGLHKEARSSLGEALREQPDDLMARMLFGETEAIFGDHAAAQEQYERALALEPSNGYANVLYALGFLNLDRLDSAELAISSAKTLVGDDSWLRSAEALMWAKRGEVARTEELVRLALARLESISHTHHTRHNLAAALATIGQPERAVAQLREAADTGLPNYPLFLGDSRLELARTHPAGAALLAGLKQGWEALRREFGRQDALGAADA